MLSNRIQIVECVRNPHRVAGREGAPGGRAADIATEAGTSRRGRGNIEQDIGDRR